MSACSSLFSWYPGLKLKQQEQVHATAIASILSVYHVTALPACTYKFPVADPRTFVAISNMVTSVGIGAYLGGTALLTNSRTLLTTTASILAVEARHDTYLRVGLGASPFPASFDTRISAEWAFNLAQMFIQSCPEQLPYVTLPKLDVTSSIPSTVLQPPFSNGTILDFQWDPATFFVTVNHSQPLYIAMVNQNSSAPIIQRLAMTGNGTGSVRLPAGVAGSTFACLTTFSGGLTLDNLTSYGTLAGPVEVIVS